MSSKKIRISKLASGSWIDNIGDTTLFYSGESSRHAKDVEGLFLDNPPRLSPTCASLVWRYYQDTDSYLIIHVQGSQVVNIALGRNYPFRAAYDVSRSYMNEIEFNIPAVLDVLPRIKSMTGGRVPLESVVNCSMPWPQGSSALRDNIYLAICSGKQLFVELDVPEGLYREDGVFEAKELKVLLGSIGALPKDIRRYASFGFCVDGLFEPVLDGVNVVVYQRGRKINIPSGAVATTWDVVVNRNVFPTIQKAPTFVLPGEREPLMTDSQKQKAFDVSRKNVHQLQGDEWQIWSSIGGKLTQLRVDDWQSFSDFYYRMDDSTRRIFRVMVMPESVEWPLDGLTSELYNLMVSADDQKGISGYNEKQKAELQGKALKSFLLREGKYDFLFPTEELPSALKHKLDDKFLTSLNIKTKRDVEQWYEIYYKNERAKYSRVSLIFIQLFKDYALRSLKTLPEVIAYMQKYPFIPAEYYIMPQIHELPTEEELGSLSNKNAAAIKEWVKMQLSSNSFQSIDDVVAILQKIIMGDHVRDMDVKTLEAMQKDSFYSLIMDETDAIKVCDILLSVILQMEKKLIPVRDNIFRAVWKALFGDDNQPKCLIQEGLLDYCEWESIENKYGIHYPNVFALVKIRFEEYIDVMTQEKLSELANGYLGSIDVTPFEESSMTYQTASPLTDSHIGRIIGVLKSLFLRLKSTHEPDEMDSKDIEANLVKHSFFNILYKTMKAKKIETDVFERRYKALQLEKNSKNSIIKSTLVYCGWFISGIVVGVACLFAYYMFDNSSRTVDAMKQLETIDRNPMLQLADSLDNNVDMKSIEDFKVGNKSYNVQLERLSSLIVISNDYYTNHSPYDAEAYLEIRDSNNVMNVDTVLLQSDNPLLRVANRKGCRLKRISIDNVSVDIPNEILTDSDTDDMTNAYLYLKVVKYIYDHISSKMSEHIAY